MTEDRNDPARGDELRQLAEARLREQPADRQALNPEAQQALVHELQVHQIELEMQNEELRRAQEELATSRDRYADLYDFAPVGYLTIGQQGTIQNANLTAAALLGVERSNLVGRPFSRYVTREDQDAYYQCRRRLQAGIQRETWELRLRKGDGTVFWAQLDCRPVIDAKDRYQTCRTALTDIAERKQLEQEQVRNQRLRAVTELAAGASHNLNNILVGVLGPAQFLQRLTDDPRLRQEIDNIVTAGLRARDLVHQLHLSVRTQTEDDLQPVPVDQIVRQVVHATRPRWKDAPVSKGIGIELVTCLGHTPPVRGIPSGLHTILTNLLVNAVDAMPQGGTITVATRAVGEEMELTFGDTGIGMDEELRQRVFEPFFTTKMEVGAGLGLSTAYGAVSRWGGSIAVDSAPGQGTTFTIRLPFWTSPEPETGRAEETDSHAQGKN